MLGGIAEGLSHVSGFLNGEDCLATAAAMAAMGVDVQQISATEISVQGVGLRGLVEPAAAIDLGNSGTAMRLFSGLLSGQSFSATMTGDESLSGRPMQRVITPLELMGARIESENGCPPLRVQGDRQLRGIDYTLPVASAQVKSAILLAGLYADGITTIKEPAVTRDHTERMLLAMGVEIEKAERRISVRGDQALSPRDIKVPADLSSASFVLLAVIMSAASEVLIEGVGVNPTRTGVLDILQSMGADICLENGRLYGEEPVADIRVRSSELRGTAIDPDLVSLAIDEFPVLFVAAARAKGKTEFAGIGELRVKESDRIATMATGLRRLGIRVDESDDGAVVHGGEFQGGEVDSHGDHRVAMSLAVAGSAAAGPVTVNDVAAVDTSFPGFKDCLGKLGVTVE